MDHTDLLEHDMSPQLGEETNIVFLLPQGRPARASESGCSDPDGRVGVNMAEGKHGPEIVNYRTIWKKDRAFKLGITSALLLLVYPGTCFTDPRLL